MWSVLEIHGEAFDKVYLDITVTPRTKRHFNGAGGGIIPHELASRGGGTCNARYRAKRSLCEITRDLTKRFSRNANPELYPILSPPL